MKRFLILVCLMAFSILLHAQDFRKGYIINKGDTISGLLDFQGDIKNSKECILISDSKTKKVFRPFEIDGYMFENGKHYISKYVLKTGSMLRVFAEYLVKGKKNLFYYRSSQKDHYLISKNDSVLSEIPYEQKHVTIEGQSYLQKSKRHIGILKAYFSDCPSIYSKIERLKQPTKRSLISIAEAYHKTCVDNNFIAYTKKKAPIKIAIEPHFSLSRFKDATTSLKQYGGLIYLWLPNWSENLYFKSGLLYSKIDDDLSIRKFPVQLSYVFPKKNIRPKFDMGVNIYSFRTMGTSINKEVTLATSGGVLVKIAENTHLDLSIETDLFAFTPASEYFLSVSLGAGVFFLF